MAENASTETVDAVVVGSGFGGSVAAYRLAEAGARWWCSNAAAPTRRAASRVRRARTARFWDPPEGGTGCSTCGASRVSTRSSSSGLGGGSLIYANVLLRKDENWFVHEEPLPGGGYEYWPVTRADLDPHYDAVEEMIGATPYPYTADTPKTHGDAGCRGRARAWSWQLPAARDQLRPPAGGGAGAAGRDRDPGVRQPARAAARTCRLCGECDIGCNDGAKNSLDHTYLSAAQHHGADLRTLHEVKGVPAASRAAATRSTYVVHTGADGGLRRPPVHSIRATGWCSPPGTYGTTYLLLRNRAGCPG